MRYLVTGGAGFIGSHLAERLLVDGNEIIVVDDLSTGSIENILHLKQCDGFSYFIETIFNKSLMAELVDMADVIYHLAASVGVRLIIDSPVRTIETNVKGTEIVLELASKKRKKVVLASTSEVYGKTNKVPFTGDDELVLGPTYKGRWSYACSKAIDEFLALAYWKEKRVPVVVARLFNTVGPRQTGRYGMVVPSFVNQALNNEPITVFGDGTQTRSFTWVGDVVDALVKLATHPGAVGEVFNIGSDNEITILQLAELTRDLIKCDSEIVLIPYEEVYEDGFEDMKRRVPDVSKINRLIGFRPTLDLPEIIQRISQYQLKRQRRMGDGDGRRSKLGRVGALD